ncbi:hypothetical protein SopranoGao_15 [Klebsiella phage SopranoGao]|uniref:Uncharacterized protein n=1 Tax=Klebsiella phage SopranoGao TaxID=2026944 RepID=A0A248SKV3_9CAUD|nr:hypothetical protein KMC54_gp15 [Klebsiella phage SopranoGao]ASV45038.1 hypothetical protein SopranoGao_15 [Klebsiella phage SopranoGao]
MVAATAVTVDPIDDLPLDNLQNTLGAIYGKAQYAASAAGSAEYKATQAQNKADSLEGSIGWATDKVGFVEYHLRAMADEIGYTVPAS